MNRAGSQVTAAAWEQTGDRSTWRAARPGAVLTVTRTAGGWQPEACMHRGTPAETTARGPVLPRRLAAQRWAERRAAR